MNFLLIDATDRSKISSDQRRFFIALSLYPLSFFTNTPFNVDALWFKIFGLSLNATFFLVATAEDSAKTFRGRPLRLGESGGTGGGVLELHHLP